MFSRGRANYNNFIDNAEIRNDFYATNKFESFGKRKLSFQDPINSRRFNTNTNLNNNKSDNFFFLNNNLQKNNLDYFNRENNLYAKEIEDKGFMDNRSRRTLDYNDFRRSNLFRINSNAPTKLDNYNNSNNFINLEWKNPRSTLGNIDSYEYLNRNVNFANGKYLDIPDKTPYFANYNNINNNNINDNKWFANKLNYAYVNNNNSNNYNPNAKKSNQYLMNNNSEYLENTASQVKQRSKLHEKDDW